MCAGLEDVRLDLNNLKTVSKNMFFGCTLGCFWFWWGPLCSWASDPPPEVEGTVGRCLKNSLCVDLDDVSLDVYHLKTGSGKRFFWRYFEWLLGSGGVSWGPWVGDPPRGVEDGVG